jgi:hypothetical protein
MNRSAVWAGVCILMIGVAGAQADLRVVHASPDAPSVDVWVDGAPSGIADLPYTGITDYVPLPTAEYDFSVIQSGTVDSVLELQDIAIDGGTFYTVAAVDYLAEIDARIYEDDNTLLPDQARVRFIHLSPNTPAVDIVVAGGGPTLFDEVRFTDSGGYVSVDPGSYDLEVRFDDGNGLLLEVPGVSLEANKVYTVFAMGITNSCDPAPLTAVVSVDAIPEPSSLGLLILGGVLISLRRLR